MDVPRVPCVQLQLLDPNGQLNRARVLSDDRTRQTPTGLARAESDRARARTIEPTTGPTVDRPDAPRAQSGRVQLETEKI
jgi:hypothetical protein